MHSKCVLFCDAKEDDRWACRELSPSDAEANGTVQFTVRFTSSRRRKQFSRYSRCWCAAAYDWHSKHSPTASISAGTTRRGSRRLYHVIVTNIPIQLCKNVFITKQAMQLTQIVLNMCLFRCTIHEYVFFVVPFTNMSLPRSSIRSWSSSQVDLYKSPSP